MLPGMRIPALASVVLPSSLLLHCAAPATRAPDTTSSASWLEVKVLLQRRCLVCHNGEHPVVMPDFTSRETVQQFIEPGDADASVLAKVLHQSRRAPTAMPPTRHFLPRGDREVIRAWINGGAPWPEGEAGSLAPDPTMPRQRSS